MKQLQKEFEKTLALDASIPELVDENKRSKKIKGKKSKKDKGMIKIKRIEKIVRDII